MWTTFSISVAPVEHIWLRSIPDPHQLQTIGHRHGLVYLQIRVKFSPIFGPELAQITFAFRVDKYGFSIPSFPHSMFVFFMLVVKLKRHM